MAIITDPDNLSQGSSTAVTGCVFATGTGADIRIHTGATNAMPALAAGEFFEVRDHSTAVNNGLYKVVTVTTSTDDYECDKITGSAPTTAASEAVTTLGATGASTEKSVHFDTDTKIFYLLNQGNIGTVTDATTGGVTMLAFHSFAKEEWKDDATLPIHPFPMIGIDFDAGKWEFGTDPSGNFSGWKPADDDATNGIYTKRLFRNAGWTQYDNAGVATNKFFNVTTLGDPNNTTDQAYYAFGNDPTDTAAASDFIYANKVNEPVEFYTEIGDLSGDTPAYGSTSTITRTTGSFVTDGFIVGGALTINDSTSNDGTYTLTAVTATTLTVSGTPLTVEAWSTSRIAVDNSTAFSCFFREGFGGTYGSTFAQAALADAGETSIVNKVIKFPLSTGDDLDITNNDTTVSTTDPYTEIWIRYLAAAYNREVDSTTKRNFGIVVDVGTYSQSNGASAGTVVFSSASLSLGTGEALADYAGGTLYIHEGTDQGTHTISGTPVDNAGTLEITLTAALTGTESDLSFTMDRATPKTADKNEIYEKVQYLLRQASDIDSTANTVNGKTADALLAFVGPDLNCGSGTPTNPNGGGSGVIIEGFDSNDTNSLYFYDNTAVKRNYPFVAAGNLNFNANLTGDSSPYYWMYYEYTVRTAATNGAIVLPSANVADLEDGVGSTLPSLSVDDYIKVSGFSNAVNNGIYIVTAVNTDQKDYTVRKLDGATLIAETGASINVDEHPFGSDGAIIVDDNSGADIAGAASSAQIAFDFDYDGNTQGGRTAATDASVQIVAIGLENGQYVITTPQTISRTTGLSYTITSSLERNYST